MMHTRQAGSSKGSIVVSTVLFVVVLLTLGGLATNVITTMRRSADIRDDERASRAAQSAIRSLKERVAMTLLDNAGSSDAYQVANTDELSRWALEKWRGTSGAASIYDGAILTTRSGSTAMASYKGSAFDPSSRFGSTLELQTQAALKSVGRPIVEFVKTWDGVDILASTAVHPDSATATASPYAVLSLFRHVRDSDLGLLAEQYQLEGLRLYDTAPSNMLTVALRSVSGSPIAYLGWKRLQPGTRVYEEVTTKVFAASAILIAFLVIVVIAGGAESRRMARMAKSARFEASHDGLSGLLNRSGLLAELDGHHLRKGAVTLHLLDLDGFKSVNDTWGHQIGDILIQKVAEAILGCHPEIVSAARLGGDEFALIQRGECSTSDFCDRVLSIFATPFEIEGRTVEVGVSIGSAPCDDRIDPFELLRRADMALYRAKHEGKGRAIRYQAELDHDRERTAALESDLKRVVAEGGITVAYQPLVAAGSGRLNGVEALARWQGALGPISPEIFIPLAERSGLIDQLGMLVLRQAVKAANDWPELGLSVNVSPVQICNPSFSHRVVDLLKQEGFDPARLTLEITEGVLMSNPTQAHRAINDLRKIGVRFSLDDFGCGYASIGALRQFGFDSMKIDRSLVWAAEQGRGGDVLKATIALAAALSIPVTAEGVETDGQADLLRDAGCDQLQGYMVGRPMSADDMCQFRKARSLVVSINRSFCKMFHVTPDDTVGRKLYDLGDGQWDIPDLRRLLEEVVPAETTVEAYDVEHVFPDIGHKIMRLNARKVFKPGNHVEFFVLAIDDVTATIAAQREADRARLLAQSIVDTIRDPLVVLEGDLTVISASRAFVNLFGVSEDHVAGRKLVELGRGQWNVEALTSVLSRVVPDEAPVNDFLLEDVFPGLGRRVFKINARKVHRLGNHVTRLLVYFEDATDAVAADRHRDTLAAELAHRIKNSLQIIFAFVSFEVRRAAEPCVVGYEAMQSRINAVAELYDVVARSTAFGPVFMPNYLEGIASSLRSSLLGETSRINIAVSSDAVGIDPDHAVSMGLPTNELATNAVKYAFPSGKGEIEIAFKRRDDEVFLVIHDNGIGMASAAKGGTGMGSRFVAAFAKQLGGSVANASGTSGTTITVRFPQSILVNASSVGKEIGNGGI